MLNRKMNPIAAAVGGVFAASFAGAALADVQDHPFGAVELDQGYEQLALDQHEGKCGEGKCGESKDGESKDGEGKCGEGKCGESKDGEGKCGEGKCGGAA